MDYLEMGQTLGRIEAKLDGLCGPEGRVTKLEKAQTRQWWLTVAVTPIIALLHGIARKAGVDV